MKLIPTRGNNGQLVWIAQTDDGDFDAVGPDPLSAVSRLAINLENWIERINEDSQK